MATFRLACWFMRHSASDTAARAQHILTAARLAGWPHAAAAELVRAGVGPAAAARLFRDALERLQ